jgi:hypothetical protein
MPPLTLEALPMLATLHRVVKRAYPGKRSCARRTERNVVQARADVGPVLPRDMRRVAALSGWWCEGVATSRADRASVAAPRACPQREARRAWEGAPLLGPASATPGGVLVGRGCPGWRRADALGSRGWVAETVGRCSWAALASAR